MAKDAFGDEVPAWGPSTPPDQPEFDGQGQWGLSDRTSSGHSSVGKGGWAPDDGSASLTPQPPVTAPWPWLVAAAGSAMVALGLGTASARPVLSAAGWVLGGFIAVGLVAIFTISESRRRADPWYTPREQWGLLRTVVLGAAVLAVAGNAWHFADWVSRL